MFLIYRVIIIKEAFTMELESNGYVTVFKNGDSFFSLTKNTKGDLCFSANKSGARFVFNALSENQTEVNLYNIFSSIMDGIVRDYVFSTFRSATFPSDFIRYGKDCLQSSFNGNTITFYSDENKGNLLKLRYDGNSFNVIFPKYKGVFDEDNDVVIRCQNSSYGHYYLYFLKLFNDVRNEALSGVNSSDKSRDEVVLSRRLERLKIGLGRGKYARNIHK